MDPDTCLRVRGDFSKIALQYECCSKNVRSCTFCAVLSCWDCDAWLTMTPLSVSDVRSRSGAEPKDGGQKSWNRWRQRTRRDDCWLRAVLLHLVFRRASGSAYAALAAFSSFFPWLRQRASLTPSLCLSQQEQGTSRKLVSIASR